MDLKIGSFVNAARSASTTAASSLKDIFIKGYSVCSFLADKVSQVAGRFIPTAVSNVVQTYPKTITLVAGIGVTTVVGVVVSRFFPKSNGHGNE